MKKILLKNADIINNDCSVDKNRDIFIEDGIIIKITDASESKYDDYETVDCSGYHVTPSFVNLHAHSAMNLFKGIAEDVTIDDWFNKEIFPYESKLNDDDIYYGTKLFILEMINNGVTAFADHYFSQDALLKAVLESGIRADIAPTVFGLSPDYKEQLCRAKEFIIKNRNISKLVKLRLGPHAPYTCPNPILKEIVDAAKELNVGIHIHVSETKEQVENSFNAVSKSPFAVIYESGGFDINVIVAHGLWIEENDLQYINDKTWFAFCPKTYMKLAMGTGGIYKFKDNVNYSFGTDGAASSNTVNPLEQARLFALNGKFLEGNSEEYKVNYIWNKLMEGHRALKFNTGKIEEGFDADLIIWDLIKSNTMPLYNPVTSIIYSSDSSNILYTMADGKFLKYNGELQYDEKDIFKKIIQVQNSLIERGKGEKLVNY